MNVELHDYTNVPECDRIYLMDITVNGDTVCSVDDDLWIVDFYDLISGGSFCDLDIVKYEMHEIYEAYKMLSDEEFECIKKAKAIKDRIKSMVAVPVIKSMVAVPVHDNMYYPADDAFECEN